MDRHFTREEAQRIFAAAVERQRTEKVREEGLTSTEIIEAGTAAGIDPDYLRLAIADFLRPDRAPLNRRFLGIPVEIRQTTTVPGALDDEIWFKIVSEIRKVFGVSGFPSELGPVREWISSLDEQKKMPVRVVAEPEGDHTRVTIERKTWPRALGFSIAVAVNLFTSLIFLLLWVTGVEDTLWIPALILFLVALGLGGGASFGLGLAGRKETRQSRDLLDRIVHITRQDQEKIPFGVKESRADQIGDDFENVKPLFDPEEPSAPHQHPTGRLHSGQSSS